MWYPLSPSVEIAYDQDPTTRIDSLLQEICARRVGLILVKKNIPALLCPQRKKNAWKPQAPFIINLCGSPLQGGFNYLRCAEAAKPTNIWLSGATLQNLQLSFRSIQKSLKTPLPTNPTTPIAFLQGTPKTIKVDKKWKKIPEDCEEKSLSEQVLQTFLKNSQKQKNLYGLLYLNTTTLKLEHIELNPNLHPEGAWCLAMKPLKKSYDSLLDLALNLSEIKSHLTTPKKRPF